MLSVRLVVKWRLFEAPMRDVPHMSASSMKQAKRNSHASFPVSVGGSEKPSLDSAAEFVAFVSSTSAGTADDGLGEY